MLCVICDKEITSEESKFMYPLEKPYLNSYLHLSCYKETDMEIFLKKSENIQKMVEIFNNYSKKGAKNSTK